MSIQVLIMGDTVPTVSNTDLFDGFHTEELVGEQIYNEIKASDFIISNLEVPLTDSSTPIIKNGPCLSSPTRTVKGLRSINPYFYNLANNHILDHGIEGLNSTIKVLTNEGIHYAGAGSNSEKASIPYYFCKQGIKLGIYCCCQHEFSSATPTSPGANIYNNEISNEHIRGIKSGCDFLIVLFHGGIEHYRFPSPELQSACRSMVNHGADLVVCQHSHCIGAEERWKDSTIIYGQGDFLFDYINNDFRDNGLIIKLVLEKDSKSVSKKISYLPITKNGNTVRIAQDDVGQEMLEKFTERSKMTRDDTFIRKKFLEHAEMVLNDYLFCLYAGKRHPLLRIVNKLFNGRFYDWFFKRYYKTEDLLRIMNIVECEAHREALLVGLKDRLDLK